MRASTRGGRVAALVLVLGWAAVASAQPANDDCANATVISSFPFADTVDMTTATSEPGDPAPTGPGCGGIGANSIWYRVPAGAPEALLRGLTEGTGTKYGVRIVTGGCGAPVVKEKSCHDPSIPLPEFGVYAEGAEVLIEIVNLDVAGTLELSIDELPEFLVDVDGGNRQTVAGGPNGFVAVWMNDESGMGAQLFDPAGNRIGGPVALPDGFAPDAAGAGDGSFFVVWDNSPVAARIDGPGSVQTFAITPGGYPVVAADADGDFVVAWEAPDGSSDGIFAQRFDRDGVAQGAAFQVNTYTTSGQHSPAVAMAATGEFVVIWSGAEHVFDEGLGARLYDASGTPVTGEFLVNVDSDGNGFDAAGVAMDPAGNFVVAWDGGYVYGPGGEPFYGAIVGRRFDSSAVPITGEFVVSSLPTTYYFITGRVDVDVADSGEFMVAWEAHADSYVPTSDTDVWARRFGSGAEPLGPQFLVNTFRGYAQYDPDVAATPAGDFMVVWNDFRGLSLNVDTTIGRVFPAFDGGCTPTAKTGCRTPTVPLKSKMLLLDDADDARDQLRWKFVKGQATDAAALGDPTADEDYVLCMYDASSPSGALLMENLIPAGGTCGTKPCWKALGNPPGSKGYRYKDKERTPHGILKMVVKPGVDGKSKVVIKGGQDNVFTGGPGSPPLPLPLPVTVQLQNRSGECWQATYAAAGVGVNAPGFYKGSGS